MREIEEIINGLRNLENFLLTLNSRMNYLESSKNKDDELKRTLMTALEKNLRD